VASTIKLLDNANQIITLLSEIESASHSVITAEIGLPRSSVYRLVDGLAAIGLVRVDDAGIVRLSARWLHLADAAHRSFPEWQHVIDRLETVSTRTGQTSFLSLPTAKGAACIAWSPVKSLVLLSLRPGRLFSFNIGAAGRLLFAYASDDERAGYLESCDFATSTDRSITTPADLLADAEEIRELGWVLSNEDVNLGQAAVGVPAFSRSDRTLGCVSISGLTDDIVGHEHELAAILQAEVAASDAD
jgi:DNA-binding IclR family transcriptional regulator